MKKILALVLTLAMLASMVTLGVWAEGTEDDSWARIDGEHTYNEGIYKELQEFTTPTDIATVEQFFNAFGADAQRGYFRLTADLDFSNYMTQLKDKVFKIAEGSVLNGCGHTLYGIDISTGESSVAGLFDVKQADDAELVRYVYLWDMNVGTADNPVKTKLGVLFGDANANCNYMVQFDTVNVYADFSGVTSSANAAAFISGKATGNYIIYNCTSTNLNSAAASTHGGFISRNQATVHFRDCISYGTVKSSGNVGGFIGKNESTTDNSGEVVFENCTNEAVVVGTSTNSGNGIGGFIGLSASSKKVTFERCVNLGSINSSVRCGGLVGYHQTAASLSFDKCTNNGNVIDTGSANNQNSHQGGFVGYVKTANSSVTINDSTNNANADGYKAGGFIGTTENAITVTLTSCVNTGTIGATTSNQVAGMIVGGNDVTVTIKNSLNTGEIVSGEWAIGLMFKGTTSSTISNSSNVAVLSGNGGHAIEIVGDVTVGLTAVYAFGKTTANVFSNHGYSDDAIDDDSKCLTSTQNAPNKSHLNTVDEAIDLLKTRYSDALVKFTKNDDNTISATVHSYCVVGGQMNTAGDTARIIGVVDSLNYESVGFKYSIVDKAGATIVPETVYHVKNVYSSVLAMDAEDEVIEVTALGGTYLYALKLKGVLEGDKITVTAVRSNEEQGTTVTYEVVKNDEGVYDLQKVVE